MTHQIITTPLGERLVLLPLAEYEALRDAADAAHGAAAIAAVRAGAAETFTAAEALAFAEARSPLAFWRARRGLTQADLAASAGLSQSMIASIEAGKRTGGVGALQKLAAALGVKLEDIAPEGPEA